jgi:hypothetical protein
MASSLLVFSTEMSAWGVGSYTRASVKDPSQHYHDSRRHPKSPTRGQAELLAGPSLGCDRIHMHHTHRMQTVQEGEGEDLCGPRRYLLPSSSGRYFPAPSSPPRNLKGLSLSSSPQKLES